MTDDTQDLIIFKLPRDAAKSRRKLARVMLGAYAANALPECATPADLKCWAEEFADAEREIARLSH